MFDDGWCPKDDLLSVNPELDMEEVTSYAPERGDPKMVQFYEAVALKAAEKKMVAREGNTRMY